MAERKTPKKPPKPKITMAKLLDRIVALEEMLECYTDMLPAPDFSSRFERLQEKVEVVFNRQADSQKVLGGVRQKTIDLEKALRRRVQKIRSWVNQQDRRISRLEREDQELMKAVIRKIDWFNKRLEKAEIWRPIAGSASHYECGRCHRTTGLEEMTFCSRCHQMICKQCAQIDGDPCFNCQQNTKVEERVRDIEQAEPPVLNELCVRCKHFTYRTRLCDERGEIKEQINECNRFDEKDPPSVIWIYRFLDRAEDLLDRAPARISGEQEWLDETRDLLTELLNKPKPRKNVCGDCVEIDLDKQLCMLYNKYVKDDRLACSDWEMWEEPRA